MEQYTYLLINLACISVPFLASFYPKHAFRREWAFFLPANFLIATLFLVWDYFFTKMGIWGFNDTYLTGIYVFNLPLEEVLFFVAIPYACVFTYFAVLYLVKRNPLHRFQAAITISLALVFLISGIGFWGKWYTATTFLVTGTYLLVSFYRQRSLADVYLAYLIIIPFFLISNGLLTGSGLAAPIVWYNDAENLGIRMGSIPIEDSVYGFLLILMNIDVYEWLKGKFTTGFNYP